MCRCGKDGGHETPYIDDIDDCDDADTDSVQTTRTIRDSADRAAAAAAIVMTSSSHTGTGNTVDVYRHQSTGADNGIAVPPIPEVVETKPEMEIGRLFRDVTESARRPEYVEETLRDILNININKIISVCEH